MHERRGSENVINFSNVKFQNINSLPCSAYVNFQEQSMAEAALNALNGTVVLPGTNSIRIDFYQRANKFLGGLNGLKREELIKNTHWRVLFIRGLGSTVSILIHFSIYNLKSF